MKLNILKVSVAASIAMMSVNAGDVELNVMATSQEMYAVGASYAVNENFKIGGGILSINGLQSDLTPVKDEFLGGYAIVELLYPISTELKLFIDGAYIAGELDGSNDNVNKALGAAGLKYNLNGYDLYAGYSTEETAFAGVEFELAPQWKLNLGGSYNSEYSEGQAIIGLSYNFESGFGSALSTSAKYLVQSAYTCPVGYAPGNMYTKSSTSVSLQDAAPIVSPTACVPVKTVSPG